MDRPVWIGPAIVNANLISAVLPALKPEGALRIEATDDQSRVTILAEGWVFCVMPMEKHGVKGALTAPRFVISDVGVQ